MNTIPKRDRMKVLKTLESMRQRHLRYCAANPGRTDSEEYPAPWGWLWGRTGFRRGKWRGNMSKFTAVCRALADNGLILIEKPKSIRYVRFAGETAEAKTSTIDTRQQPAQPTPTNT